MHPTVQSSMTLLGEKPDTMYPSVGTVHVSAVGDAAGVVSEHLSQWSAHLTTAPDA